MKIKNRLIYIILFVLIFTPLFGKVKVKIRDLAYIDGFKENQVFGFGLVVGLQGSGDSKLPVTKTSLRNVLKYLGLKEDDLSQSKNVAAVLLTAKLPAFVRVGERIDVTVSSIGDAKSLEGGILIQSPLKGADNRTYLVAQGRISIPEQKRGSRTKAVKTGGTITRGGIVERAIVSEFVRNNSFSIVMHQWDFAMADSIVKQVKEQYPGTDPKIETNGKISFKIPANAQIAELIANIQNIEVEANYSARVVVNEKDGTIVMGGDVKVSEALVSKDGITVRIQNEPRKVTAALIKESTTVKDLVESLNYIGASSRDLISILKALKSAGALHAELVIK